MNLSIFAYAYGMKELHIFRGLFYCGKMNFFINIHYVCDGINDCLNGEDELNCSFNFFFLCNNKPSKKVNVLKVCDFINDCPDQTDEKDCGNNLFKNYTT